MHRDFSETLLPWRERSELHKSTEEFTTRLEHTVSLSLSFSLSLVVYPHFLIPPIVRHMYSKDMIFDEIGYSANTKHRFEETWRIPLK